MVAFIFQDCANGRRTPRPRVSSLLRLWGYDTLSVQLLRNPLETIPAGIHLEDSSHDGCLILPYLKTDAGDYWPSVLVSMRHILDRQIVVPKASSASVKSDVAGVRGDIGVQD
jgi:hypothetical protein